MEYFCTGVGFKYLVNIKFFFSCSPIASAVNSAMGGGQLALASTGMSSYFCQIDSESDTAMRNITEPN